MRPPLDVPIARNYWKRLVWLVVLVTPFAAMAVAQIVHDWDRGSDRREMAYAMMAIIAVMYSPGLFWILMPRWWVARFDEHGVMLRNGRRFAWQDFVRVDVVKHRKLKVTNHHEIVFTTGKASVAHWFAANEAEVLAVLRELDRGANPFTD